MYSASLDNAGVEIRNSNNITKANTRKKPRLKILSGLFVMRCLPHCLNNYLFFDPSIQSVAQISQATPKAIERECL
jgi:hypothetical protein